MPACIIRPSPADEVSTVVKIVSQDECHFAIKYGGHARFARASNADGGITVGLRNIDAIEVVRRDQEVQ